MRRFAQPTKPLVASASSLTDTPAVVLEASVVRPDQVIHPPTRLDSASTRTDDAQLSAMRAPHRTVSTNPFRSEVGELALVFMYVFLNRFAYHAVENRDARTKAGLQALVFSASILFRMVLFGCTLFFSVAMESLNLIFQGDRNHHNVRRALAAAICLPGFFHFLSVQEAKGNNHLNAYLFHALKLATKCGVIFVAEKAADGLCHLFSSRHKKMRRGNHQPVVRDDIYPTEMKRRNGL